MQDATMFSDAIHILIRQGYEEELKQFIQDKGFQIKSFHKTVG